MLNKDQSILISDITDQLKELNKKEAENKELKLLLYRVLTGNFDGVISNLDTTPECPFRPAYYLLQAIYDSTATMTDTEIKMTLGVDVLASINLERINL